MIVLKNIQLSYAKPIIKRANLTVHQGEILGLVGKSGAGKSSLLKIIAGLIDPDTGEISIDQHVQPRVHQLLIPGFKRVAMVNQDFKLDVYHTVEENLREAVLHLPSPKRDKRVQQLLRLFDLKSISATKAHLISGGEQQRLAIARAIADQPEILLLDEPSLGLAPLVVEQIIQSINQLSASTGLTVLLVEQNANTALAVADHGVLLALGKVVSDQPAAKMRADSALRSAYLGY